MIVKNLQHTKFSQIVDCLLISFADYVVKMPDDVDYWEHKWNAARVKFELSFGMFDGEQLVGFIINGIDEEKGKVTAFNSGTGVIPEYRGQQIVDAIYAHAVPLLQDASVQRCSLEVIKGNDRAIRVYERIGFTKIRQLKCFKGEVQATNPKVIIEKVDAKEVLSFPNQKQYNYSWDNRAQAIVLSAHLYDSYLLKNEQMETLGYFIINPQNGYCPQFEIWDGESKNLLNGIAQISTSCRINNVDSIREEYILNLLNNNFTNSIDQYEMEMDL